MSILVTGGAGFIGSHLVSRLIADGNETRVIDNLSSGRMESLSGVIRNPHFKFTKHDLLQKETLSFPKGCTTVYHLAANPEVRISAENPEVHFTQNVVATFNMLEAARRNDTERIVFTSTSTVYGDAAVMPTPEDYSPMEPISMYGASKLACESIMISYAHTYGMRATVYRLANIIGEDSTHGVIYDFVNKLLKDPTELEILGDGSQNKSYLHVSDCISAMLAGESARGTLNVFNVGSQDQITVRDIAGSVIREMGLAGVRIFFTGGVDNGRGWQGDVKNMLLDVSKIISMGWKPLYGSSEAVRLTAKKMVDGLVYPR
ncbi:MAG: NAD-dependent epimerase/dehydratase family protein [Nitrososphaera sp.]